MVQLSPRDLGVEVRPHVNSNFAIFGQANFVVYEPVWQETGEHRTMKSALTARFLTFDNLVAHLERLSQVKCKVTGVTYHQSTAYDTRCWCQCSQHYAM